VSENPYQSPGEDDLPADRPIGLRSWHVPFIIAAVCGAGLAVIFGVVPRGTIFSAMPGMGFLRICLALLAGVLVMDIFVCGLVIFEWWRTGEPPELSFEPLIPCAERRALYRAWKERPQLDDDQFYSAYYAETDIAREIVTRTRRELQTILGRSLAGVHPKDDMSLSDPELDFADVFDRFDKVFHITIPWRTGEIDIDGSFDSLVRLVVNSVSAQASVE
jgi:hypothetical protein